MYCYHCGAENEEGSRFCEVCGKPISEETYPSYQNGSLNNVAERPPGRSERRPDREREIRHERRPVRNTTNRRNHRGGLSPVHKLIIAFAIGIVVILGGVILITAKAISKAKSTENPTASETQTDSSPANTQTYSNESTEVTDGNTSEEPSERMVGFNADGSQQTYTAEDKSDSVKRLDFTGIQVGQYIPFGRFEQDNIPKNGAEDIEWEVLCIEDDRALLISRYILEEMPFNEKNEIIPWVNCTLRQWLNNDFYYSAFTPEEQAFILTTELTHESNAYTKDGGEPNTLDEVFVLNINEVIKYYPIEMVDEHTGQCDRLKAYPTRYAADKVWMDTNGTASWWLRTMFETPLDKLRVTSDGKFGPRHLACNDRGHNQVPFPDGVRPAMWVAIRK